MSKHVAVLGSGTMGTTLAHVVASGGRPCVLWSSNATTVQSVKERSRHDRFFVDRDLAPALEATGDLREAVDGAPLVISAVPSTSVRDLARRLGSIVTQEQTLFSATKGIELPSLSRLSEVLREETRAGVVGVISGPNITHEIMAGQLTGIVVASTSPSASESCARALELPKLRVYANDDLVGVELSGALKNVIAIAVGIATGLDLAVNTRSLLLTRAIAEIGHLVGALGGKPSTFFGLAGIADLYLTCTSPQSLNREIGIGLGRGGKLLDILSKLPEVPEGTHTARACQALARSHGLELPIAEATCSILDGTLPASALEASIAGPSASYDVDRDRSVTP
jgi:glycerol-3-phosphate dehydrogenase (NAD(P)+)